MEASENGVYLKWEDVLLCLPICMRVERTPPGGPHRILSSNPTYHTGRNGSDLPAAEVAPKEPEHSPNSATQHSRRSRESTRSAEEETNLLSNAHGERDAQSLESSPADTAQQDNGNGTGNWSLNAKMRKGLVRAASMI